jgi:hypothetical protein
MNPPAGQSPPDMVNVYGLLRSQASQALGASNQPDSRLACMPYARISRGVWHCRDSDLGNYRSGVKRLYIPCFSGDMAALFGIMACLPTATHTPLIRSAARNFANTPASWLPKARAFATTNVVRGQSGAQAAHRSHWISHPGGFSSPLAPGCRTTQNDSSGINDPSAFIVPGGRWG